MDLKTPLSVALIDSIRSAWLQSQVLCFPEQQLNDDQLEAFSLSFGLFGHDPFIKPIAGREHIIAVERKANEQAPIFANT